MGAVALVAARQADAGGLGAGRRAGAAGVQRLALHRALGVAAPLVVAAAQHGPRLLLRRSRRALRLCAVVPRPALQPRHGRPPPEADQDQNRRREAIGKRKSYV